MFEYVHLANFLRNSWYLARLCRIPVWRPVSVTLSNQLYMFIFVIFLRNQLGQLLTRPNISMVNCIAFNAVSNLQHVHVWFVATTIYILTLRLHILHMFIESGMFFFPIPLFSVVTSRRQSKIVAQSVLCDNHWYNFNIHLLLTILEIDNSP